MDSSIGGKTAVNLAGIKNAIGAFFQPKKVLIDIDTLRTLPERQISAGLVEALKMSVTFDPELFKIFEEGDIKENIEDIIARSLRIKADVVKKDEKESGLRKVLNFGHTIGHGIESQCLDGSLFHGECVALGMLPMASSDIRERLIKIYEKLGVPQECNVSLEKAVEALTHDKKAESSGITIIESDKIGTYKVRKADKEELKKFASLVVKGA